MCRDDTLIPRIVCDVFACGAFLAAIATASHPQAALALAYAGTSILLTKHALFDEYSKGRTILGFVGGLSAGAAISTACGFGSSLPAAALVTVGAAVGTLIGSDIIFPDRSVRGIHNSISVPVRAKLYEWGLIQNNR